MLRTIALAVTVLVVCCVLAASVSADRLILIPEGTTLTTGQIKGEFDAGATNSGGNAYWVNLGVTRLEIEGAWFKGFSAHDTDAVSAQISVLPETSFTPAIALGIRDIGDKTESADSLYDGRSLYVAASKGLSLSSRGLPFLSDLKVHAGIGTGSLSGIFFGAEAAVSGRWHLAAEYDTHNVNLAAMYNIAPVAQLRVEEIQNDMYFGAVLSTAF
jgi:hypothetical protein